MNSKTSIEQDQTIDELAAEVEEEQGGKISERKRQFALLKLTDPSKSNTQLAKDVGAKPTTAKQTGYQLANDPKVLALQAKIKDLELFGVVTINPTLIKNGLLKEAVEAKDSRDRRGAWDSLAKSEGMYKETVVHHNFESDQEFLKKLEKELGTEAAKIAAIELGLDWIEQARG